MVRIDAVIVVMKESGQFLVADTFLCLACHRQYTVIHAITDVESSLVCTWGSDFRCLHYNIQLYIV